MKALITGAGSGIGRATALRLARDAGAAARLLLVDLNAEGLADVAAEVAALGGTTVTMAADVGDPGAVADVGARAAGWLDGLDALVSNAGFFPRATKLISMDPVLYDRMFDVNTRATWLLARATRPLLAAARGAIVATASISADEPTPGIGNYSANKAALVMLVRQLAYELGPEGIRCNCVSPGTTRTGINDYLLSDPVVRAAREAMLPLGRLGRPEDLANAIAFLAGPDAAYITGVNLLVDGGLNLTLMPSLASAACAGPGGMTVKGKAYVAGAFEHPLRKAPKTSVARLHAECAAGALADAGLTKDDVDGYFCAGDAPGLGPLAMADHMNLRLRHLDSTDIGGASYIAHVAHAAAAIAAGKCRVALITLAGRPRSEGHTTSLARPATPALPDATWEAPFGPVTTNVYAMCAMRHMHEFGTTPEQLAAVKVAASHHAQHNPHAMLREVVTVQDVLASPMVADPLHRLDCCVVSDGGGALVVVVPEVARSLGRPLVKVLGAGEAWKGQDGGRVDLTFSGARWSGAAAFAEAGVAPADIRYASIYDSFTITVLIQLEDLGFCAKGEGGRFVEGGNLISGIGRLPINTDGGGLCNNHPANRGGITKVIEAVRQLRGEAHPAVQVPDCALALAHGTGGLLGSRHGSATLILERE